MGALPRDVGNRRAIGINAHSAQLCRDHPHPQPHQPRGIRTGGKNGIQRRQPFAPMGRVHPLHPPAFLIDQDRGITPDGRAQIGGQSRNLLWGLDISGKEDKAERVGVPKKCAFFGQQRRPGAAETGRHPAGADHL